jgi:hypothetical protein
MACTQRSRNPIQKCAQVLSLTVLLGAVVCMGQQGEAIAHDYSGMLGTLHLRLHLTAHLFVFRSM